MAVATNSVLLVEDDPGQARLAEKVLTRAGFAAAHVPDGAGCLRRVREQAPSFVVLDRGLPDGDGLQVLRTLRAEHPDVSVIMLTGSDEAGVAVDALRLGAADYVVKRADLSHLTDLPLVLDRTREHLRLVSERAALDQAVRASEQRYRELFENASDAIFVCDQSGRLQQVNQAFATLAGAERHEIEGRELGDYLVPSSPTRTSGLWQRALGTEEVPPAEVHLRAPDGRVTVLDVKTRAIALDGAVRGFQGIGRDVTERRRVEQMKADFLAMVTHDMKNPVSIIVGYAEILLNDGNLAAECREMLVSIDSSARGLLHLIMNFLDLSRIEAGALHLHRVETSINDVLRQVMQYQSPLARAKRIAVVEDLTPVPPLLVDRGQMDRVFVNLVGNAIKFTPPGGRVIVQTTRNHNAVDVQIRDTGPGIPTEQMPQLFGKYQRLSPTVQTEGTGLGLFIAKSMIDAHGGSVRVESQPNHGATFIVSLPLAEAAASCAQDHRA